MQMYRCAVGLFPSSAITILCMNALAQGLRPALYRYLLSRLLEREFANSEAFRICTAKVDGKPDMEWVSFSGLITEIIRDMPVEVPVQKKSVTAKSTEESFSPWDFLLKSSVHQSNLANLRYPALHLPEALGVQETLPLPGPSVAEHSDAETTVYFSVMVEILEVLHAVYEDCKLDTLRWRELWQLANSLSSLAAAAGEMNYVDHYTRDFPTAVPSMPNLVEPTNLRNKGRAPPNLFQWLEDCLKGKESAENVMKLPVLLTKIGTNCVDWSRKVVGFFELLTGSELNGRQLPSGVHISVAKGTVTVPEQRAVLAMVAEGFGLPDLDRLPPGVSLPLRHVLNRCRESPPADWPAHAYVLVGREDLASTHLSWSGGHRSVPRSGDAVSPNTHVDDVWMAAPYMLHLRPVPILAISSDGSEPRDLVVQAAGGIESQMIDGMEHVFTTSAPLRFGRDLRLNEVRRLLGSSKPVAVRTANSPDVSDPDIVAQQQAQLWQLAQRTTAIPFGRGAFTLATSRPMLTEALPIPKLVLAGRLPSQHDATVNLDAATGNLTDVTSWPEFHNGVAAGLRLAPGQAKITRTWIVYNKPDDPNFSHAGLLMALGLHKHLGVLAATDVYRYLAQEHEATTVGVLLGMAAAHRGTMDPAISKVISTV
jgi:anaphase-promoting complex subunit 1